MIHINCVGERRLDDEKTIVLGSYTYQVEQDWLKWPEELPVNVVLNGTWAQDGNFYTVTGKKEYPVVVFDREGNYLRKLAEGEFDKSHSIFETKAGTFLIADAHKNAHVVKEIDKEGNVLKTFGTKGAASDSGYDFDAWKKMEAEGKKPEETPWNHDPASNARIQSICRRGEPFNRPCGMIQACDGEYYAADGYGNCAVHRFDTEGNLIASWGEPGTEPGQFRVVHAVLIDRYNRVWIADRENGRVQMFSRDGELLAVTAGNLSRVGGICADNNYLYIGELDGGITVINLETLECDGQAGAVKTFMRAHGISLDGEGNLYTCSNVWNPNNVIRFKRIQ